LLIIQQVSSVGGDLLEVPIKVGANPLLSVQSNFLEKEPPKQHL
jgi:hypothetical protein